MEDPRSRAAEEAAFNDALAAAEAAGTGPTPADAADAVNQLLAAFGLKPPTEDEVRGQQVFDAAAHMAILSKVQTDEQIAAVFDRATKIHEAKTGQPLDAEKAFSMTVTCLAVQAAARIFRQAEESYQRQFPGGKGPF